MKELYKLHIAEGKPDGLTIDTDGNLWMALAKLDFIGCFDPETGVQGARVDPAGLSP